MEQETGVRMALVRRWYLLPVCVLLTGVLAALAYSLVPARYEVTARILLVPAAPQDDPDANPYMYLGGLEPAVAVLAKTMSAPENATALEQRGATSDFMITPDLVTGGPVLLIDVDGVSPRQALRTLEVLVQHTPDALQQLQRNVGVPAQAMIGSTVVSRDVRPTVVRKSQIRAVLVATVVGGAGGLLSITLLDALLLRRQATRGGRVLATAADTRSYEPVHLLRVKRRARTTDETPARAASDAIP